jgi:hypothetical protein
VKTAEFNALCHREHEQDGGVVVKLYLTGGSYAELLADVLSEPVRVTGGPMSGGVQVGARLDAMTNPATRTPVSISPAITKALFADTAEVTRWVSVVARPGS